jgi:hypothetical protein
MPFALLPKRRFFRCFHHLPAFLAAQPVHRLRFTFQSSFRNSAVTRR